MNDEKKCIDCANYYESINSYCCKRCIQHSNFVIDKTHCAKNKRELYDFGANSCCEMCTKISNCDIKDMNTNTEICSCNQFEIQQYYLDRKQYGSNQLKPSILNQIYIEQLDLWGNPLEGF